MNLTNYTNGRNREYEIKHLLEAKGYTCFRTAGSHSKTDIIAIKDQNIYFIQSKKGSILSEKRKAKLIAQLPKEGYIYSKSLAVGDEWKTEVEVL